MEPLKLCKQKNILFYKEQFGGNREDGLEDEIMESEKALRRLLALIQVLC